MNIEQGQHQRYEQNNSNTRDEYRNRGNSKDMDYKQRAGATEEVAKPE
jgi:hypothetical protein